LLIVFSCALLPQAAAADQHEKKGTGSICAQHPEGRSGKLCLSPFSDQHEIWLLSTRGVKKGTGSICAQHPEGRSGKLCLSPFSPEGAIDAGRYWRLTDDCQWAPADAGQFHAGDGAQRPTVVYIHGNRTDADEAVSNGGYVDWAIQCQAAGRPFRFVIWSWPSDRACRRNRSDVQLKAEQSDVEAYYLACWLDQLRPGARVSLVGHSFGPRIIDGAMQLLAGGELAGQCLPAAVVAGWSGGKPKNPVRAVLLASATDADWLAPGGCHELALGLLDEVLITCNGCDRALRWYPRLYGRGGPEAMGFVGPCGIGCPENVEVLDLSGTVGRTHDWQAYCSSPEITCHWAHYAFLDAPAEAASARPSP
jgi:hypothetical protein